MASFACIVCMRTDLDYQLERIPVQTMCENVCSLHGVGSCGRLANVDLIIIWLVIWLFQFLEMVLDTTLIQL
jgi:hypothetical protein